MKCEDPHDELTLFAPSEVARRWGCSRRRVDLAIKAGELHAVKLGERGVRVSASELRRFLADRAIDPVASD